jgi:hypothetical protein
VTPIPNEYYLEREQCFLPCFVDSGGSDGFVEEGKRAEKVVISDDEAGAANAGTVGDDMVINKDYEGGSPTKKRPSEESNAPFTSKEAFGAGFDATVG